MPEYTTEPVEDDAGEDREDDVTVQIDPPPGSPVAPLDEWIERVNNAVGVDAVSFVAGDESARIEIVGESIPGDAVTDVCSGPADHRIVALHTTDAGLCRCSVSLDPDVVDVDAGREP